MTYSCVQKDTNGYPCYQTFDSETQAKRHQWEHIEKELLYENYFYRHSITTEEDVNQRHVDPEMMALWGAWKEMVQTFMNTHVYEKS